MAPGCLPKTKRRNYLTLQLQRAVGNSWGKNLHIYIVSVKTHTTKQQQKSLQEGNDIIFKVDTLYYSICPDLKNNYKIYKKQESI